MKILNMLRLNVWHLHIFGFVCLFSVINGSTDLGYLKEQPSFFAPCKIADSNNNACLAKTIESFYKHWNEVAPALENLDPQHAKKVEMVQRGENINLKMRFKDMTIAGFSKGVVKKASISDDYTFKYLIKYPSLNIKAKYHMKGSILLLKLNLTGDMELKASDVEVHHTVKTKLIEANNQKFFDANHLKLRITKLGSSHLEFKNVPADNADLAKTTQDLFNQSWDIVFELVRPVLEETLEPPSLRSLKSIYHYIPAKYLFMDLPVN